MSDLNIRPSSLPHTPLREVESHERPMAETVLSEIGVQTQPLKQKEEVPALNSAERQSEDLHELNQALEELPIQLGEQVLPEQKPASLETLLGALNQAEPLPLKNFQEALTQLQDNFSGALEDRLRQINPLQAAFRNQALHLQMDLREHDELGLMVSTLEMTEKNLRGIADELSEALTPTEFRDGQPPVSALEIQGLLKQLEAAQKQFKSQVHELGKSLPELKTADQAKLNRYLTLKSRSLDLYQQQLSLDLIRYCKPDEVAAVFITPGALTGLTQPVDVVKEAFTHLDARNSQDRAFLAAFLKQEGTDLHSVGGRQAFLERIGPDNAFSRLNSPEEYGALMGEFAAQGVVTSASVLQPPEDFFPEVTLSPAVRTKVSGVSVAQIRMAAATLMTQFKEQGQRSLQSLQALQQQISQTLGDLFRQKSLDHKLRQGLEGLSRERTKLLALYEQQTEQIANIRDVQDKDFVKLQRDILAQRSELARLANKIRTQVTPALQKLDREIAQAPDEQVRGLEKNRDTLRSALRLADHFQLEADVQTHINAQKLLAGERPELISKLELSPVALSRLDLSAGALLADEALKRTEQRFPNWKQDPNQMMQAFGMLDEELPADAGTRAEMMGAFARAGALNLMIFEDYFVSASYLMQAPLPEPAQLSILQKPILQTLDPYQKALVEYEGQRQQKPELTFDHFMLNDGAPYLQMLQLFDALSTTLPRQPEVLELFQLGDRLKRTAISGSGVESKDLAMVEAMSKVTPETLKTLQHLKKSGLSPAEKQAQIGQLMIALDWQAPADASKKVKKMYEVLETALLQEVSR